MIFDLETGDVLEQKTPMEKELDLIVNFYCKLDLDRAGLKIAITNYAEKKYKEKRSGSYDKS